MNSQKPTAEPARGCKLNDITKTMLESSGLAPANATTFNDEYVISTFINFLEELNIDVDAVLNKMPENIPHPECFHQAIRLINLETVMSTILQNISEQEMNFNDLVDPKQKKFNKIVRYIGNFLSYYKYTNVKIDEKMDKINQKRAEMERILEDQATMEKRMMETIRMTEEKQKNCEKIKRQMEESAARLAQKKKLRPDLLKLLKEAREEHDKRLANLTDLKSNLLELQQMKAELERKLVSSPSKINAKSLKVEALKKQREEEIGALKKSKKEKNELFEQGEDAQKSMGVLMKMIQEIVEIKKNYRSTLETVENQRKTLEELKLKLNEAEKKKVSNEENKEKEDKELSDLKVRCEAELQVLLEKKESLESEMEYVKEQLQIAESEKENLDAEAHNNKIVIEQLTKEIEEFMEKVEHHYQTKTIATLKMQKDLEKQLE